MNTDPTFWMRKVVMDICLLDLMAVHGALCLALRHPHFKGETRDIVVRTVKEIGNMLVFEEALTLEQLVQTQQLEAEEGTII